MKKISVILGALALGCVAMLTSCKNGAQDVNVTNWSDMYGKSYICDISNIVVKGDDLPDGVTFSAGYGEITFGGQQYSDTNYDSYYLDFNGFKYKVGTTEGYISGLYDLGVYKLGDTYYARNDDIKSVAVDPNFESAAFTVKITFKDNQGPSFDYYTDGYNWNRYYLDSISMKFTRK